MNRREYAVQLFVNDLPISSVKIDPHYEARHRESIDDLIILELVKSLDGKSHPIETEKFPFQYFMNDNLLYKNKLYRLIWVLENDHFYIGVINAYRR